MNEKKPANQVWTDGNGDEIWAVPVCTVQPTRSAALVGTSLHGVFLTAAECREVAGHLTELADAHEEAMSRPPQGLPAEYDGAVLVPADGCRAITTTSGQEFSRLTFTTKQSIWYGPNLAAQLGDWVIQTTSPSRLILGTWKEADQ